MKKNLKALPALFTVSIIFFYSAFCSNSLMAQGNLLVTPKRVVFEGNKKSEEINLANIGTDTASYVISLIQIRMNENGTFEKITQPDSAQLFADKNIRFFPRSVTLAPNEAQTVKIQLIKTGDMAAGEYRSHLYLRSSPLYKPLGEEKVDDKDSVLSVKITPIYGISIPVIIRRGESNAGVTIPDLKMDFNKDKEIAVNITFNRSGSMSVYGDVLVDHISPQGKTTRVGLVKGMAVYCPNATRRFHLVLDKSSGVNFREGKLKVVYADQSSKTVKLADAELALK